MRTRRRIGVAAGLAAVVVAAAVAVPSLLHHPARPAPITPPHHAPKVTVARLGGHVAPGLVARGTIGSRGWRITFRHSGNQLCVLVRGDQPSCSGGSAPSVSGIASLNGPGTSQWNSVVGQVRRDVTMISIGLSDGAVLDLHPLAWSGFRWVGLVVPHELRVTEAVAYAGRRELGYAIPFTGTGSPTFGLWLHPGQTGPARVTRLIGSGAVAGRAWSAGGYAGPWGYCVVLRMPSGSGSSCGQASRPSSFGPELGVGAPPDLPRWVIGTVRPSVAYLRLTRSDRSTIRVPVVEFAGVKYYALAITKGPRIVRWGAYDSAGRELYGGQGAPELGSGHGSR